MLPGQSGLGGAEVMEAHLGGSVSRWEEEERNEAVAGGAVGFEKILVLF